MNTGNYSSLNNQKGANLCLKCAEIRLAAGLCAPPDPLAAVGDLLLRGRREGAYF